MAASINLEDLSFEEQLKMVERLSLDPSQQVNPDHQNFMKYCVGETSSEVCDDLEIARRMQEEENAKSRLTEDTSNDELLARRFEAEEKELLELRMAQEIADEEAKNELVLRENGILRNTYAPEDFEQKEEEFQTVVGKTKKKKEQPQKGQKGELRPIIIDGQNIAWKYGNHLRKNNKLCDANGLKVCYDYFRTKWNYPDEKISIVWKHIADEHLKDKEIIEEFKEKRIIVEASSRKVDGQRLNLDDDTLALDIAYEKGGIIISFDNFRNHFEKSTTYHQVIRHRVIDPTFDHEEVRFHPKPKGDKGPSLKQLLRF